LFELFDKAQGSLREFALQPGSANPAGNPKGHDRVNTVLGPFNETTGLRTPVAKPEKIQAKFEKVLSTLISSATIRHVLIDDIRVALIYLI